jgi:periplasmic divalent cation tolerance protein
MEEILVFSTTDTPELAHRIALSLVDSGVAACVNIVPGIRSIYRWQGKVCDESEQLLLIKTTGRRFEEVRSAIRKLHTYQVPEIISVPISAGDHEYLRWLASQTSGLDPLS